MRIHVELDGQPVVGGSLEGTVRLAIDRPLATRSIGVWLLGNEGVGPKRSHFLRSRFLVGRGGELAPGTHSLRFSLRIPAHAPPSFESPIASVVYRVRVHVDIPWWPDARLEMVVRVIAAAKDEIRPQPQRYRMAASKPGQAPPIELSLSSDVFGPGDQVGGVVMLSNEEASRADLVDVRLVGQVHVHGGATRTFVACSEWVAPGPFMLTVPELPGSFSTGLFSLSWYLEVEARRAGGGGARGEVRVHILPRGAGELPWPPPPIGESWRAEELRTLAEGRPLVFQDGKLVGRVGDTAVELRSHPGEWQAELAFPPLGMGLSVQRGKLRTRVAAFARMLVASLAGPAELRWVDASDGHLVASAPHALAAALADWLLAAAARLATTRQALLPPGGMSARLPAWRRLAEELGGRLEPGPLVLTAVRGGMPVRIAIEWDDEVAELTRLSVDGTALPVRLEEKDRVVLLPGGERDEHELLAELDRLLFRVRALLPPSGPFR